MGDAMGVNVSLRLFREQVSQSTWKRIYLDSLTLLRGWSDPPLGIGYREVAGVRVIAHTRNYERENGWCVVGDANSRRSAECFELPMRLNNWSHRQTVKQRHGGAEPLCGPKMDALRALADEDAGKPSRLSRLLGNRTQGLRYHTLIVAVATLIENRLPGLALACGDFDKQDADRACDELARIFGERFERPVLLDPERIQLRISEPETALLLSKRHTHEVIPEVAALFKRLYARMHVAIVADLDENSLICTDSDSLCDDTRMAFAMLGFRLAELSPHLDSLPASAVTEQLMLQSIAAGTLQQNLLLTDMAWDSIEASDLKTREFLYRLCQLKCDRLEMHQMLLAIYENPVVRDFVMSVWRAELDRPCTLLQTGQLPLN